MSNPFQPWTFIVPWTSAYVVPLTLRSFVIDWFPFTATSPIKALSPFTYREKILDCFESSCGG